MSGKTLSSSSVVQANKPLRMFAFLILTVLIIAHFLGTINLIEPSILWLPILMSLNAIQATYTGFCPMFKDKQGNCVACGVQCSENKADEACCDSSDKNKASCCSSDPDCCSGEKTKN